MIMLSLIGEQPIPNLLPLRHQPPEVAVLVYSDLTDKGRGPVGEAAAAGLPGGALPGERV